MFKKYLLDILFPIQCLGGCTTWDVWLCEKCAKKINHCNKQEFTNSTINGLYYITEYNNTLIQKLIHQLKYSYSQDIASILGKQLNNAIDQNFDYIVPVPLHKKRYLERGFNQSELIASFINKNKILNNIIVRSKNTKAQAQLDEKDRSQNIQNAFKLINDNIIKNKKILIIDDVYTTGNTINQVAKTLKQNSPQCIWAACIAKG